jgi:O-acetyl-ADP-ribose deacetylase (regulator of RNase III)
MGKIVMNREISKKELSPGKIIKIIQGDITAERVDAIVNAANSHLRHGGGVAGAIVRKGGNIIQEESDKIGQVPVGMAAMTSAGQLPADHVIHAVGPRWGEGDEDDKLRNAVTSSLLLADENQLQTISLPAISAGIFGFPLERCAQIILQTIRDFVEQRPDNSLKEVRICLFDAPTVKVFMENF